MSTVGCEDAATWKALLAGVEALLENCCDLAQRFSTQVAPNAGARSTFCVARAFFSLLDVYPAIGATVVTATARLLAEETEAAS